MMHIKEFVHVAFEEHICSGKYMIITCDVDFAVSFVLAHLCKNVGSICMVSLMAV